MRKPLTASEETALLKDTIREAHETIKDLRAAIREARNLAPSLVAEFEALHEREMHQLSNHLTEESNRASADINAAIDRAKDVIMETLAHSTPVIDTNTGVIALAFNGSRFDDHVPLPYPEVAPKGTPQ